MVVDEAITLSVERLIALSGCRGTGNLDTFVINIKKKTLVEIWKAKELWLQNKKVLEAAVVNAGLNTYEQMANDKRSVERTKIIWRSVITFEQGYNLEMPNEPKHDGYLQHLPT